MKKARRPVTALHAPTTCAPRINATTLRARPRMRAWAALAAGAALCSVLGATTAGAAGTMLPRTLPLSAGSTAAAHRGGAAQATTAIGPYRAWTPDVGLALVIRDELLIVRSSRATTVAPGNGVSDLSWSPDGRFLAFERSSGDTTSLWTVRAGGTELRRVVAAGNQSSLGFAWSSVGDSVYFATSAPFAIGTTIEEESPSAGARSIGEVPGEVTGIAATGGELAVSSATYRNGTGFVSGSIELLPAGGGAARTVATSRLNSFELPEFSPHGHLLVYAVDPSSSASIAADGLDFRVYSLASGSDRSIGAGLTDGEWRSWSTSGAFLAITLGDSRAAWATDKRVVVCDLAIPGSSVTCKQTAIPARSISYAPNYGSGSRLAYVTAEGLGGPDGFGKGAPLGSDAWVRTFRVWASEGSGKAHEIRGLDGGDDPQWVAGGPGLLAEDGGALWYLRAPGAAPARVTPSFLVTGFGYYGDYNWSSQYALAPD